MQQLSMGIVGYGAIGRKHAVHLLSDATPRLTLGGVVIRKPEQQAAFRAEHPDIPVFSTAEDLYRSGAVEAVLLATPHKEHPPEAEAAFAAGLHVLTEKPAGVSVHQAEGLPALAKQAGKVYGIMYNQRTDPLYQAIRVMVQSGQLGPLRRVTWIVTHWYRSQAYHNSSPWHSTWAGEGGGVLLNQSIHQLDLWQWMFGMPQSIRATAGFGKYRDIEVEDEVSALLSYDSGLTGHYITSTGEVPGSNRLEIACSMGKLVAEDGKLTFWRTAIPEEAFNRTNTEPFGAPTYTKTEISIPKAPNGHAAILNNFADAVLDGAPLLAPGEEATCALTLANAMLQSAWTGQTVSLSPFDSLAYDTLLAERTRSGQS